MNVVLIDLFPRYYPIKKELKHETLTPLTNYKY